MYRVSDSLTGRGVCFTHTRAPSRFAPRRGAPIPKAAELPEDEGSVSRPPLLCFAHVTNQMAVIAGGFEKGEAAGAIAALAVISAAARIWRETSEGNRP
jgi:hypothetical protein